MDIQLNCTVEYPMQQGWQFNYILAGEKPFSFFGLNRPFRHLNLIQLIKQEINRRRLVPTSMAFVDTKTGDITRYRDCVYYENSNALITMLKTGGDTILQTLKIDSPVYTSDRIFDKYSLGAGESSRILFFRRKASKKEPYDLKNPDLIVGFNHNPNRLKINFSEIDFVKKSFRESLSLTFTKIGYNGQIRSYQDLENALMVIDWQSFLPNFQQIELRYGENYANIIKLDPKAIKYKNMYGSWNLSFKFTNLTK